MTVLIGIAGVAALFALLGFVATRDGTRLEGGDSCHGDSCGLDDVSHGLGGGSCGLHGGCQGCAETAGSTGWWPDRK